MVLGREPRLDPLAHREHPRLGPAVGRPAAGQALEHGPQGRPGVADEAERRVGRADPLDSGVDLDEAPREGERVLRGRLGPELGPHREDDVGGAEELLEGGLVGGRARGEGCEAGIAPLPMYVVATGMRRASASATSSASAPDRRTPPPAQITGRSAASRRRSAWSTSASSATAVGAEPVASAAASKTGAGARRTSTGTSTKTGPEGGVTALRQPSASTAGISWTVAAVAVHLTIEEKTARWSASSCR